MATRATYRFAGGHLTDPTVTYYLHWDGYPQGAAHYFLEALKANEGSTYRLIDVFHRANAGAEITRGHELHGDTEYRYDYNLETGDIAVRERRRCAEVEKWEYIYAGTLARFIEKYAGEKCIGEGGRILTREIAAARAERLRKAADDYAERFPQYTGNIDSMRRDAERAEADVAKLNPKEEAA